MDLRHSIVEALRHAGVEGEIPLEQPANASLGDFAFPCFGLAKKLKKMPGVIAAELATQVKTGGVIEKVVATGPYVNFFVSKEQRIKAVLHAISSRHAAYGASEVGKGKTIVIDYSSPNIGKPMGIHHLGSTVIGHALANIYKATGHNVVAVNHLGDWGTQFGILIAAYKRWGDAKKLDTDPVNHLLELYVRYTKEEESNTAMHDEAKQWFKKLEDGDTEAHKLWQSFRDKNLVYFQHIYKRLGITFDAYNGEAFYNDKMDAVLSALKKKNIIEKDEGALIVRLDDKKLPPLIAQKSDEASTYALRDLAAISYRVATYKPDAVLYVVASQQSLHFQQLFAVAAMLGHNAHLEHVSFGMMRLPEGKMSTRKGSIILMEEVLNQAVQLVAEVIEQKNPELAKKAAVAEQVGIGAITFGHMLNDRIRDVEFAWERILDLEGDTGPYVQYTHARACSILRKAKRPVKKEVAIGLLTLPVEYELSVLLEQYPDIVQAVLNDNKPHTLTQYLLRVCHAYNAFYHAAPILTADGEALSDARLLLCDCSRQVLANGLSLLGVAAPDEM